MRTAALALALAACSIPSKHFDDGTVDAPPGTPDAPAGTADARMTDAGAAFACRGQPFPTTAPSSVTVSAQLGDPFAAASFAGAIVTPYSGGNPVTMLTADANGKVMVTVPTGGVPLTVDYVQATMSGYDDAYFYPTAPVSHDLSVGIYLATPTEMSALTDAAHTVIFLEVVDCTNLPVEGATVSTTPAATINYVDATGHIGVGTATSNNGVVFITGATAGVITLDGATSDSLPLRSHQVTTRLNTMTVTAIQP